MLASCKSNPAPAGQTNDDNTPGLKYLALGDSYTIGESVSIAERWPVILAKDLSNAGKPVKNPDIIALTGWTTRDLLDALDNHKPSSQYDMVSLLIGVNNQYRGRDIEEYRKEFRELLLKSISYATGDASKVFVLSIPDWGVTPYGTSNREKIGAEINSFNKVAKEECDREKVVFINITDISRKALNDPAMLASDKLHFSGKMHQLWVNEALPKVKSLL
jgi:lysophospholipase L1-like esterase